MPARTDPEPTVRAPWAGLRRWWKNVRFPGSGDYWERRYRAGDNSGAGSYGPMAEFKAEVLNAFVRERSVRSVIEFGCGDGAQLALADYPSYTGLDVSAAAVELCRRRFAADPSKRFFVCTDRSPSDTPASAPGVDTAAQAGAALRADLALSLDVVYHLVEETIYERHLRDVFAAGERFVIVYSSDFDRVVPAAPHVRHRNFTRLVAERMPEWRRIALIPNRYPYDERDGSGSLADFHLFERAPRAGAESRE